MDLITELYKYWYFFHFQVADSMEERASFHLSSCGDFLRLLSYNCRKNKNMDMHFWWVILWSSKTTFSILQMISIYFLYAINHEHFGLLISRFINFDLLYMPLYYILYMPYNNRGIKKVYDYYQTYRM